MRLIRFFLVLLLSVALPFTNVAAAAMVHCAQPTGDAREAVVIQADTAGMHAHHHAMHAQQDKADHHHHHASDKSGKSADGCSQCSYCQSCASAFFPSGDSRMPAPAVSDIQHGMIAGPAPTPHLDQLFRPPRLAFA